MEKEEAVRGEDFINKSQMTAEQIKTLHGILPKKFHQDDYLVGDLIEILDDNFMAMGRVFSNIWYATNRGPDEKVRGQSAVDALYNLILKLHAEGNLKL